MADEHINIMDQFFYIHSDHSLGATRQKVEEAAHRANKSEQLYEELMQRHEKMALVCQALLELVQERTGITDDDLEKKILEVDLRDGKADGQMKPQISKCPTCGRNVSSKRPVCIFCGTESKHSHTF